MKQKLTLASMVLFIIEAVCFFIPHTFEARVFEYDTSAITYHGQATYKYSENLPANWGTSRIVEAFASIAIILLAVSFICYLISLLRHKDKLLEKAVFLPIISFVFFIVQTVCICLTTRDGVNFCTYYEVDWMFYIMLTVYIVSVFFSLLIRFKKFYEPKAVDNSMETLMRYKELLDIGAITQEEFDAKKKQLLEVQTL